MSQFTRFHLPQFGASLSAFWETIKAAIPSNCFDGPDEKIHFAKFGRGPNDTELSNIAPGEGAEGMEGAEGGEGKLNGSVTSVDFVEGEFGAEGGKGGKIDEWQAAWNVTNAIQVNTKIIILSFL